ncbi:MAG TPA: nitroreductase family deazaflavin-dependent oxidoreductase [Acidimicrobiales bacterium]|nr:nitroreductase family deazaflavin-dependent oxidoreductase [Acidimicrobiales bacterium]
MSEMGDFNARIVEEFRSNAGKVGGQFDGAPLLLLHHFGARTNTERVNPVMYQPIEGGFAIFASKAGAPDNPDWYHNLVAHPETTVEVGAEVVPVRARVAKGDERTEIWEKQKRNWSGFADYERNTDREIPVVILERAA